MRLVRLFWNFRYYIVLALMVSGVFAINFWSIPAQDELAYTFQGMNTPFDGVVHHVENLKDVVEIQLNDYKHGPNGRIFLHSVVALFSGWELYTLFDVANTLMWFLLVWLILREGRVTIDSTRKFVLGAAIVFCLSGMVKHVVRIRLLLSIICGLLC